MTLTRRNFLKETGGLLGLSLVPQINQSSAADPLLTGWKNPPRDCRPQTRWWWPGNAISKEGIQTQLTAMKGAGIGGVEIISSWQWYEKGNLPYLSDNFFKMIQFTAERARLLDMSVSLAFGAGQNFGGFWVPVTERSKCLAPTWLDITGPQLINAELPAFKVTQSQQSVAGNLLDGQITWQAIDQGQIIAVVAAQVEGNQLKEDTLTVITTNISNNKLQWEVPAGQWQIGIFRLQYTGQPNSTQNFEPPNYCVDHFNPQAMRNYVNHLGGIFTKKLGKYFGTTISSFFADSFELTPLPDSLLWSNNLLAEFNRRKGYDLTRYLPVLWRETGAITSRIRYDVNEFLYQLGKENYYGEFTTWCKANRLQARIQPHHRFTNEVVEAAGLTQQPETEVCTARFETIADPRKATASGAKFYGREIVSAEAYTFIHPERYRTTLEEMKRATDAYLRDGVTQIINHGWTYSEELEVAPERDMPGASQIQPWMPWFKHYRGLSDYVSRSCWLLRQGNLVADILIYSPHATAWSESVIFDYTRQRQAYGNLPKTLLANGYDYDLVNDDLLQNRAEVTEAGELKINQHKYRILILPKATVIPLATMRRIEAFALAGGVVIALDQLPRQAGGLQDTVFLHDGILSEIAHKLFNLRNSNVHFLPEYKISEPPFSSPEEPYSKTALITAPQRKLLEILREITPPDVSLSDDAQSDGLTFIHRRAGDKDIYFLTNLQPEKISTTLSIRVTGRRVDIWDAMSGQIKQLPEYRTTMTRTEIPLTFFPWESLFLVFQPNVPPAYVTRTDLAVIETIRPDGIIAYAAREGEHSAVVAQGMSRRTLRAYAPALPQVIPIRGQWNFTATGVRFARLNKALTALTSWTESQDTRYLSGEGIYEIAFTMTPENMPEDVRWILELGTVAETADVTLNNKHIGVRWMQPYDFDVTRELKKGENLLRIAVTNTLHNHVAGLKAMPDLPPVLKKRYQQTFSNYELGATALEQRDLRHPLLPSGLFGPVRLVPQGIVLFKL